MFNIEVIRCWDDGSWDTTIQEMPPHMIGMARRTIKAWAIEYFKRISSENLIYVGIYSYDVKEVKIPEEILKRRKMK